MAAQTETVGSAPEAARPGSGDTIDQAGEQRSARIESLRALAALAVLFGHVVAASIGSAQQLTGAPPEIDVVERALYGGGLGVFFFFALTGYLLFWPFARRDFGSGEAVDLRRYGFNRVVRILPLYFAVVIVVLVLHDGGAATGTWLRYLTMTLNLDPSTAHLVSGLDPTWSIIVEVHFYLLLPLLAWLLARACRGSLWRAGAVLLLLAGVSLAIRWVTVVVPPDPPDPFWRLNIPATFLFFVPGMMLALIRLAWRTGPPGWLRGPLLRSDLWMLAALPIWAIPLFVGYHLAPLVGVAAFLMVGACVLPLRAGRLVRVLEWRPLALLGVASYSLYIWHVPSLQTVLDAGWATSPWTLLALAVVPATIVVAFVSYRAIEAPFLRLREQWSAAAADKREPASGVAAKAEAAR